MTENDLIAEPTGQGTTRIVIRRPSSDSPGYWRRNIAILEFRERIQEGDISGITGMLKFLTQFVTEPSDDEEKLNALLDASQNQWMQILDVIAGDDSKNVLPTATGES